MDLVSSSHYDTNTFLFFFSFFKQPNFFKDFLLNYCLLGWGNVLKDRN